MDQNCMHLLPVKWPQELFSFLQNWRELGGFSLPSRLTQSYPTSERGSGARAHQALEKPPPLHFSCFSLGTGSCRINNAGPLVLLFLTLLPAAFILAASWELHHQDFCWLQQFSWFIKWKPFFFFFKGSWENMFQVRKMNFRIVGGNI